MLCGCFAALGLDNMEVVQASFGYNGHCDKIAVKNEEGLRLGATEDRLQ